MCVWRCEGTYGSATATTIDLRPLNKYCPDKYPSGVEVVSLQGAAGDPATLGPQHCVERALDRSSASNHQKPEERVVMAVATAIGGLTAADQRKMTGETLEQCADAMAEMVHKELGDRVQEGPEYWALRAQAVLTHALRENPPEGEGSAVGDEGEPEGS